MTVISFDDWGEMGDYLRRSEEEANTRVTPEQREVGYGSLWLRFYDIPGRVVIFGRVHTLAEIEADETRLGADPGELAHTLRHTQDMLERNFLFGTCWSTIEPRGELGNTHRCEVWACPQSLFDEARRVGWDIDAMQPSAQQELEAIYQQWRRR